MRGRDSCAELKTFIALLAQNNFHAVHNAEGVSLVDVAHVRDAEHFAFHGALAGGDVHVELFAERAAEFLVGETGGVVDAGDGVRGLLGEDAEPEGVGGGAGGGGEGTGALPDVFDAFRPGFVQRDEEAADERDGGGPRDVVFGVALEVAAEVEIEVRLLDGGGFFLRLFGDAEEAEAGGKHEGLLRAGDDDIDAPFIGLDGERTDGGDAVGDEDGVGIARQCGDALQVGDGAGGSFGVARGRRRQIVFA